MARKRYEDPGENHERWLISYADFITLLFAFFVVMYAISSVNEGKYKVFSQSLGNAFGGPGQKEEANNAQLMPLPNPLLRKRTEAMKRERERLTRLATDLKQTMAPLLKSGKVRVTQNSRGVSVEINASVLFDPGDAKLQPESVQALRSLAAVLKDDQHAIQVEGYTDDVPISNASFPSNWELSATRASSVVRLFVEAGVPQYRMSAVGFADNEPVAPNATPEGRARNRRVAVTILSTLPDVTTEIPTP
ncbi:flagellar motor protein MotD [Massilia arenosa]|uniref:Flagellar motor protein MotD n=1 Tax=Zemynaea arenosa TaxID=2561931 RepID=A0A4Y9SYW3_9BURK|nr:flagellar motor protein MotD [Massilia arenosa]TFW29926.1 flagellar motor protein MotD [Massilia arenosa]